MLAIETENMELIECLLSHGASAGDALLHAISEEYVEAVERLLMHEELIHVPGRPYVSLLSLPPSLSPSSIMSFSADAPASASDAAAVMHIRNALHARSPFPFKNPFPLHITCRKEREVHSRWADSDRLPCCSSSSGSETV